MSRQKALAARRGLLISSERPFKSIAVNVSNPPITSNAWTSNPCSLQRRHLHIKLGLSLSASPARLRVSQVRTALRSVAHAAMRPYRGGALCVPVCPFREHGGARPRLRSSLWSVLLCKTIPPLHPPACPAPPLACSRRANLASKHTHMSMEAYPPDGPQISPPQGSQNFSERAVRVGRFVSRVRLRVW